MKPSLAVKELRKRMSMSQQAFATELGLSISAIATYEAGRNPTGRSLLVLSLAATVHNHGDLAKVFWQSFFESMGFKSEEWNVQSFSNCSSLGAPSYLLWFSRGDEPWDNAGLTRDLALLLSALHDPRADQGLAASVVDSLKKRLRSDLTKLFPDATTESEQ